MGVAVRSGMCLSHVQFLGQEVDRPIVRARVLMPASDRPARVIRRARGPFAAPGARQPPCAATSHPCGWPVVN
jgi:hypothetical protein